MKVKLKWSVRFKKWIRKATKKVTSNLPAILVGLVIMLIVTDALTIYSGQDSTRDIATSAAVVAYQVLEQASDKTLAEKQASALVERHLAKFERIEFRGREVEVTVTYRARTLFLKFLPFISKLAVITATGSYPTT